MRAADVDWRLLRGGLVLLLISASIAGGALAASHSFTSRQVNALQRERSAFLAARSQYHALDEEEDIIATYLPRYLALEDAGIIGREQRLDWIDVLRESARAARVQSLSYVLNAQQSFDPGMTLNVGDYAVYASSMRLDIGLLHEGDLLEFLARLHEQMPGLFGVTGCRMARTERTLRMEADAANVEVQCTLNFYTLRKADAPARAS
jgi:hypothetical protein